MKIIFRPLIRIDNQHVIIKIVIKQMIDWIDKNQNEFPTPTFNNPDKSVKESADEIYIYINRYNQKEN